MMSLNASLADFAQNQRDLPIVACFYFPYRGDRLLARKTASEAC
ncbi:MULTISPECIES: hypothetical protein [Nostoc]|nr:MULTISPECIES: hypothetical protein [Nostoc]